MKYKEEYRLKQHAKDTGTNWWYVQGILRNEAGKIVRYSQMTATCMKQDAERMFQSYKTFSREYTSGELWRGEKVR